MESLLQDLRYAIRVLVKSRVFTAVAAISLALAIGANTTIFSVAKQLLYERLAVSHAADLRLLSWTRGTAAPSLELSYPVYQRLREESAALADLIAFHVSAVNVTVGENAERVTIHEVSGNYYAMLGVQPQLGRAIAPADDRAGSAAVVVISDGLWARQFDRSPSAIGRTIQLNDVPATIVGVNPRGFTGAASTLPAQTPDVTVSLAKATLVTPSSNGRDWLNDPASQSVNVLGRLKPGVTDAAAQPVLETRFIAAVRAIMPPRAIDAAPKLILRDGSRGRFAQRPVFATPLAVLMLFLILVLLLACANIATLMLTRGVQRQREMRVRVALGASRGRILRQMLVESLALAAIGGAGGWAIAYVGRGAVARFAPRFDWPVFAFTALVTIVTGVLFGFAPALAAMRTEMTGGFRRRPLAGNAVVGFQIALATLLLVGAGLFVRSLNGLIAVDPGFRTDRLLLAQVVLPQNRYPAGANVSFHQRLEQAIAEIPGVASASGAEVSYLGEESLQTSFLPEGEASDPRIDQTEPYNAVGIRFFETLGIPIVAGRGFNERDTASSPKVAVINRRLAAARFPNQDPIGKHVSVGVYAGYGDVLTAEPIEIVGICGDTLYDDLHAAPAPQFFVVYAQQRQVRRLTYQIRTHADPQAIIPALRRVVHTADPALPLVNVRTQQEQIDADLADERLLVSLTSTFGLLALLLASIGIYGVTAHSVSQRTKEFGIRIALGARPGQVATMVLGEASWLSASAIAVGVAASFVAARFVKSMLFGISPSDPPTLWGAAALLMAVALGASWIPARRAASVAPMDALRRE